jgi:thymidine kinase
MAKLYFRYGTVGSAKTLNLLAVAHAYNQQNKKVLVIKPSLDDRFGLAHEKFKGVNCVLVDEAQFLSSSVVDQLRAISIQLDLPVICYGLRTDFRTDLFEGARRLLEVADEISEVKTTCFFCDSRALFNLKFANGKPTREGPAIDLGAEEKYLPACARCYSKHFD